MEKYHFNFVGAPPV